MKTGAVLAVTLQEADQGDTTTVIETLGQAGENGAELIGTEEANQKPQMHLPGIEEVVTDKGYHSGAMLVLLKSAEVRTYIPEKKQKGQRDWDGKDEQQQAVYANRRRVNGAYGKRLLRKRGELIERSFAHCYDTGAMRRTHLRGHQNILKATVDSRRCVQFESDLALSVGIWHPTGVEKPPVLPTFCAFSAAPSLLSACEPHKVFLLAVPTP